MLGSALFLENFYSGHFDGHVSVPASSTGSSHSNEREEQSTGNEQNARFGAPWEWGKGPHLHIGKDVWVPGRLSFHTGTPRWQMHAILQFADISVSCNFKSPWCCLCKQSDFVIKMPNTIIAHGVLCVIGFSRRCDVTLGHVVQTTTTTTTSTKTKTMPMTMTTRTDIAWKANNQRLKLKLDSQTNLQLHNSHFSHTRLLSWAFRQISW